jgi:hypothetical protein
MPDLNFGSPQHTTSICKSGSGPFSDIPMPTSIRKHADGVTRTGLMRAVGFYGAGVDGPHSGRASFGPTGSQTTPLFTLPKDTSAQSTGLHGLDSYFQINPGTTARLTLTSGQPFFYGWGGSGLMYDGIGGRFDGLLAGTYRFAQAAFPPDIETFTSTADGLGMVLSFQYPAPITGDVYGGDVAISGFRAQIATDAGFTQNVRTVSLPALDSANANPQSVQFNGLAPLTTYYARLTSRNLVSDTVGTLGGEWSMILSGTTTAGYNMGQIYSGGTWQAADALIFNGTGWVPANSEIWNGSAWVDAGS